MEVIDIAISVNGQVKETKKDLTQAAKNVTAFSRFFLPWYCMENQTLTKYYYLF